MGDSEICSVEVGLNMKGVKGTDRLTELPAGQILAKPYHYGALIRRIDDLLAAA